MIVCQPWTLYYGRIGDLKAASAYTQLICVLQDAATMATKNLRTETLSRLVKDYLASQSSPGLKDFVPDDFLDVLLSASKLLHKSAAPNLVYLLAKALINKESRLEIETISFKLIHLIVLSILEQNLDSLETCSLELQEELDIIEWNSKLFLPGLNEILFPTHALKYVMAPKSVQSDQPFLLVPYDEDVVERLEEITQVESDVENAVDNTPSFIEVGESDGEIPADRKQEETNNDTEMIAPYVDDEDLDNLEEPTHDEITSITPNKVDISNKGSETRIISLAHSKNPEMIINPKDLVKMYQCLDCPTLCKSEDEISKHVKEVHKNAYVAESQSLKEQSFVTFTESGKLGKPVVKVAKKEATKRTRVKSDPTTTCSLCTRSFPTEDEKEEHEKRANCLFCQDCDESFSSKSDWLGHHQEKHSKLEKLCTFCNKQFKTVSHLNRHVECVHFNVRKHSCDTCGRGFFERKDRVKHEKTCVAVDVDCPRCSDKYRSLFTLKIHLKERHGLFLCVRCKDVFPTVAAHRKHMNEAHKKLETENLEREKCICEECGKVFANKYLLKRHVNYDHLKLSKGSNCELCNKTFRSPHYLKRHIRVVHEKRRDYCCEICGKSFSASAHLQEHKGVHDGIKRYKCEYCGEGFVHRASYRRHAITHIGKSLFPCALCHRKFDTPLYLKSHVNRVHKGAKIKVSNFEYPGSRLPSEHRKRTHGGRQSNKNLLEFREEDKGQIEISMTTAGQIPALQSDSGTQGLKEPSTEAVTVESMDTATGDNVMTHYTLFQNNAAEQPALEIREVKDTEETEDLDLSGLQVVQVEDNGTSKLFYIPEGAEYVQIGDGIINLENPSTQTLQDNTNMQTITQDMYITQNENT